MPVPGAGLLALVPSPGGPGSAEGVSSLSAVDGPPMQRSRHISLLPKPLTKMGFDEVSSQWTPRVPLFVPLAASIHAKGQSLPWASAEPLVAHPAVARQAVSPAMTTCPRGGVLSFLPRSSSSTCCGDRTGASACWRPCRSWR